jgi:hypothetical protein
VKKKVFTKVKIIHAIVNKGPEKMDLTSFAIFANKGSFEPRNSFIYSLSYSKNSGR